MLLSVLILKGETCFQMMLGVIKRSFFIQIHTVFSTLLVSYWCPTLNVAVQPYLHTFHSFNFWHWLPYKDVVRRATKSHKRTVICFIIRSALRYRQWHNRWVLPTTSWRLTSCNYLELPYSEYAWVTIWARWRDKTRRWRRSCWACRD